jgi:hypothetical protein
LNLQLETWNSEVARESARMIANLIHHKALRHEVFSVISAAFCKIWIEVSVTKRREFRISEDQRGLAVSKSRFRVGESALRYTNRW